ncbi:hypothetical protein NQ317_018348 [Molorchus minor]|uniref:Uncharacterized protein n=1 Tax=Molorchus minor TaxID=1323400 RepID=A0ABQ9IWH1_9CUCU|nr:hypothetical protein NQ317_018348 [Molorchus minor]
MKNVYHLRTRFKARLLAAETWSKCILHVKKEEQRCMWDLDSRAEALIEPVIYAIAVPVIVSLIKTVLSEVSDCCSDINSQFPVIPPPVIFIWQIITMRTSGSANEIS